MSLAGMTRFSKCLCIASRGSSSCIVQSSSPWLASQQLRSSSDSSSNGRKDSYFGWLREVFSEQRIKERKESLRDELKRGYVNDLKDFRANQGKVFRSFDKLLAPEASFRFPELSFVDKNEKPVYVPADDGSVKVALVCIAFRNGAEDMLASWRRPFRDHLQGRETARIYDASLVDSGLMGMWPFRQMIMNGSASAQHELQGEEHPLTDFVFHFGETREARKALGITNLLTGYVYLLDSQGRVRWRGSGMPDRWEVEVMLHASDALLKDKK